MTPRSRFVTQRSDLISQIVIIGVVCKAFNFSGNWPNTTIRIYNFTDIHGIKSMIILIIMLYICNISFQNSLSEIRINYI